MSAASPDAEDPLIRVTCSISIDGQLKGTGWLIDEQGHIITAGHVLGKDAPFSTVQVAFLDEGPVTADRVYWSYDHGRGIDCAVLKMKVAPTGRRPLPLSLNRNFSGSVRLYGFGKTLVDMSPGRGDLIGPFHPENMIANRMFALDSKQTREQGYSGAAIYSEELAAIVAIQVEGTTVSANAPQGTTVLAMPLYRIAEQFPAFSALAVLKSKTPVTNYWYHVYLSYDRGGIQEKWVEQFLKQELSEWLQLALGVECSVFSDHNPRRTVWDNHLRNAIRRSLCLVPVLTPSYWRSPECLAELKSFHAREEKENIAVVCGLLFHKEGAVPPGIKLPVEDFREHASVWDGFRASARYGNFQDQVKSFANQIAGIIRNAPECESDWPVATPSQMNEPVGAPARRIERPNL